MKFKIADRELESCRTNRIRFFGSLHVAHFCILSDGSPEVCGYNEEQVYKAKNVKELMKASDAVIIKEGDRFLVIKNSNGPHTTFLNKVFAEPC